MQMIPSLYIAAAGTKGRGVFTAESIPSGSLIEICPILLIPSYQTDLIDQTELFNYYFIWDSQYIALALGYGSVYNHSAEPNARVIYDYEAEAIQIEALRDIQAAEEILINYLDTDDPSHTLWFDPV
jgi:uncharacterized protein